MYRFLTTLDNYYEADEPGASAPKLISDSHPYLEMLFICSSLRTRPHIVLLQVDPVEFLVLFGSTGQGTTDHPRASHDRLPYEELVLPSFASLRDGLKTTFPLGTTRYQYLL